MSSIVSSASLWLTRVRQELQTNRTSLYAVLGVGTLLIAYVASRPRRNRKLPPGPWLPTATRQNQVDIVKMEELIKKHGPIINFRIFTLNLLFLCDVDSIKEALVGQGDALTGRMQSSFFRYVNKDCGIVFIEGPKWQEHRRFILSVLRSFGFGKNITERIIQEEMVLLCDEFGKLAGSPVYPRLPIIKSITNVICILMFGGRSGTENDFDFMVEITTAMITSLVFNNIFVGTFFKLFLHLPGDCYGVKTYFKNLRELEAYTARKINEHRQTIDWNNQRDLIDAYLIEMRKREQESPGQHTYTDFQLQRTIMDLFIAGMETTSNTITWCLLLMAKYPHIQARVQAEIDSAIGDRLPQIADRAKLVYTTAVLHEVSRYSTVAPFSVPHRVTEDIEIRGYYIPKNTIVTPYVFGAHRDEHIWKNPKQFDPSHFYDESSNSLVNVQNLLTFSVGKRACLGESLATQELFVFFAGLLQRFKFEADASHPLPTIEEKFITSAFRFAPKYKLVIRERKVHS